MTSSLLIKNGICITPEGRQPVDILCKDGKIVDIAGHGKISDSNVDKMVDAKGQFVLPGLIDTQVHFREPGNEHKENLEAGTKGAALGGLTGVFEMPNTNPLTITKESLQDKLDRMKDRAWTNFAFYIGGTPEHGKDWHELEILPGCCGIKIFMGASTGNLLVEEDEAVRRIFQKIQRRAAIHSEDNFRLEERKHLAEEGKHPRFHHVWRDKESAIRSTQRVLKIARETGAKVHVLHITTAEELELLAQNKDIATVEMLPQHLTFNEADYETLGSRIQMNPPIRDEENREKLWELFGKGIVDVLGSDHAPHTLEEKSREYPQSPSGMPGVQTIVPIMLDYVNQGKLSLERLVDLMCGSVPRIWGLKNKGRIAVGYDSDFTIVDLEKEHTFTDGEMANVSGWTPYIDMTVKGMPTHTIIANQIVMQNGELDESLKGIGRAFEFNV